MNRKTRRVLSAISLAAVCVAPAMGFATDAATAKTWTFHHENVLGTSLQITVRAMDEHAADAAESAALGVFDQQTEVLSAWRADSEFSRWEKTRFEAIPVSASLLETLAAFDKWRERTEGALDPSVEAATRLWKLASAEGRVPTDAEIAQTREAIAQPHWSLDRVHGTATRLSDVPLALATFAKSRITSQAADAALAAGARGVMLNVGGDVVVRGAMTQMVAVANPRADAENDSAMDFVVVSNAAVATSGDYRRGAHLFDPNTAQPVANVLSSTVIAPDAETAGALATAFAVMQIAASQKLAAETPGVQYLLVAADGRTAASAGWAGREALQPAAFVPAAAGMWNPAFELAVELNLPRSDDARYRRPYVAVWVEDKDHFPVRTLSLWTQNPRWLPELKAWYRDDQIRNLAEGTDISKTISSATRPAGKYNLKWDGKDNEGKLVKAGDYTIVVEASREHGGYQVERKTISFTGTPAQETLPAGKELGIVNLDYRKR